MRTETSANEHCYMKRKLSVPEVGVTLHR